MINPANTAQATRGLGIDAYLSGSFHTGLAARRGRRLADMTIQRMDNVAIVVDDLDAAVAFFTALGMELEGKGQIEGLFADRTVGLDGVRSEIAMMRTPDGHSKLELTKYHTPAAESAEPENPPPNTLGLHRVMFAVDDINDTVARLRAHGAELLGEVAQYESIYLLCYLRGPAGIIVALAEQIG
jgi:catechol 2,3-dioxygenase-like lactoylglutathione lyase family enzyme